MRMLWKVIVLIVGVLLAGAAEPAVAGSATQNDGAPVEVSGGGMSPVASGLQEKHRAMYYGDPHRPTRNDTPQCLKLMHRPVSWLRP